MVGRIRLPAGDDRDRHRQHARSTARRVGCASMACGEAAPGARGVAVRARRVHVLEVAARVIAIAIDDVEPWTSPFDVVVERRAPDQSAASDCAWSYPEVATGVPPALTRTAQYLNSGILPNGSRTGLVSRFAAAS